MRHVPRSTSAEKLIDRKWPESLGRNYGALVEEEVMELDQLFEAATLDGRRTKPAVFALEHIPSGRRLTLSTRCLSKRLYDQRSYLARGDHHNPNVQADLLADGPEAFRLVLLDLVSNPKDLPFIKRLHVAQARKAGLCYNPPDPAVRNLLLVSTDRATGEFVRGRDDESLAAALQRLAHLKLGDTTSADVTPTRAAPET